jgi:hypothetical protein
VTFRGGCYAEALAADRSTGESDESKVLVAACKMLAQLPLEKFARTKAAQNQDGFEAAHGVSWRNPIVVILMSIAI